MGANGNDPLLHELAGIGFTFVQRDRRGVAQYARMPNRFLTEWVHDDGLELLFTWEYDLGEFAATLDWQIGAAETSSQVLYPRFDARLPRSFDAVVDEVRRLEQRLSGLDLADPSL